MTWRMARKPQPKIEEACPKALDMLGEVRRVVALIHQGLKTPHGNRKLHDDMALGLLLCAFFEPRARSLRTMDQLSAVPGVKELLGSDRLAKSTLSDALGRFETAPLPGILRMIQKRLPQFKEADPALAGLSQEILAGDGSAFRMAGEVAWALQHRNVNAKPAKINSHAKLHLQMDVRRCTPRRLQITGKDDSSEQTVLGQNLEAGVIYLLDRGYCGFDLLNRILNIKSHFVIRLKKDLIFRVERENPLSAEERALEIRGDEVGLLGKANEDWMSTKTRESHPPERQLRRVTIWDEKNRENVILLTDLMDVEAKIIGHLYRSRWLIELFFRWLKATAGFAHLVSQSPAGVTAQLYVGMIGTLLIHLHTGMRVSQYSLFAMEMVMGGKASYADMLPGVMRLERERMLAKRRLDRIRAEKLKVR